MCLWGLLLSLQLLLTSLHAPPHPKFHSNQTNWLHVVNWRVVLSFLHCLGLWSLKAWLQLGEGEKGCIQVVWALLWLTACVSETHRCKEFHVEIAIVSTYKGEIITVLAVGPCINALLCFLSGWVLILQPQFVMGYPLIVIE